MAIPRFRFPPEASHEVSDSRWRNGWRRGDRRGDSTRGLSLSRVLKSVLAAQRVELVSLVDFIIVQRAADATARPSALSLHERWLAENLLDSLAEARPQLTSGV